MTAPGELNRRLVLEAPVETADGAGGVTRGFAAVTTVWAKVEPVSARYDIIAAGGGATVTHRIIIRGGLDVSTRNRFTEGARIFRIVAVRDEDATRRFRVIHAEERTG